MFSGSARYRCQLHTCNVTLALVGVIAVGLAASQFSKVGLNNYRDIDIRLINWIHILTAAIGSYSLLSSTQSHGAGVGATAASKSLYCISIIVGIATAIFYGFTTYKLVQTYNELLALKDVNGFEEELSGQVSQNLGKIIISAIMIGVGAIAALVGMIATLLLERITIDQMALLTTDEEKTIDRHAGRLTAIVIIKLVVGGCALALAVYLEYEHELVGGHDNYIKIALDHLAAMFVLCSAIVDLYAIYGHRQTLLNFKVSITLSIVAAVWCLKSIDNAVVPFYVADLRQYRTIGNMDATVINQLVRTTFLIADALIAPMAAPKFIIVVVHGTLIGCFALLFFVCTSSAVHVGACVEAVGNGDIAIRVDRVLSIQRYFLGTLHTLCGLACIALAVIALVDARWSGNYAGADLLWIGVLFIATGCVGSSRQASTMTTSIFVLSVSSASIAIEKLCVSINLVYQSSTTSIDDDSQFNVGQVLLYSIQTGVLLIECITAFASSAIFGSSLVSHHHNNRQHHHRVCCSLGILCYGIVLTGVTIVFEVAKWRYSAQPLAAAFDRIASGPLALAIFGVQLGCACRKRLLLPACILQTIVAALGLFVLSPCVTNLYYLAEMMSNDSELLPLLRASTNEMTFLQVAVILTAASVVSCILATGCGIGSALRSAQLLFNDDSRRSRHSDSSSMPLPHIDQTYSTLKPVLPRDHIYYDSSGSGVFHNGLFWSADENPYYYQQRYPPYQIESGFYGYSLAGSRNHSLRRGGAMSHSASQTRIGHVFNRDNLR